VLTEKQSSQSAK